MEKSETLAIVFDDHLLFADSFSALIERLERFHSVYTFTEEKKLIRFLLKHFQEPIYLFLDYYLKDKNALQFINMAKRLNKHIIIIIVSAVTNPAAVADILRYNISGLVSKASGSNEIRECINTIDLGEQYISPVISEIVSDTNNSDKIPFTARELELLQYFAQGLSIIHTAERLNLSKYTVVAHRRKMMAKVNVNSIIELLSYARKKELI